MKHPLSITLILIWLFVVSQVIGLALVNIDAKVIKELNEQNQTIIKVTHEPTAIGERPQTKGAGSFILLIGAVLIGTIILLFIARFGKFNIWKAWYLLAVWLAMSVAFGVILGGTYALILALIFSLWKVYGKNPVVHNITEIFVYSGIAVLIAPILNLIWAIILLLAISLYDMFAVWKTKHMVKMALFQARSEIFAGLLIPKKKGARIKNVEAVPKASKQEKGEGIAMLGGGDIAFPLIFSSVVMEHLISLGITKQNAFLYSLLVVFFSALSLSLLLFLAKKHRFYPAMPFITAGCLIGYMVIFLSL